MTLKDESPRSEGVQYAPGEEWRRTTNIPRKNEAAGPKRKWCSVVDVPGDESKIQCCKEQYCIGTWDVRSVNQGKLDMVKQEMVRINIDIVGISGLKYTEMGEFNFSSVQSLSRVQLFVTPWTAAHYVSLTFPSPPRVCSNSCPLNQWCHPIISYSVTPFSSCPQSFPA